MFRVFLCHGFPIFILFWRVLPTALRELELVAALAAEDQVYYFPQQQILHLAEFLNPDDLAYLRCRHLDLAILLRAFQNTFLLHVPRFYGL